MARIADPLSHIPAAESVRKRLAEVRREAAKLEILLRTAEEIEAAERDCPRVIAQEAAK